MGQLPMYVFHRAWKNLHKSPSEVEKLAKLCVDWYTYVHNYIVCAEYILV